jgi:hypothetical protein
MRKLSKFVLCVWMGLSLNATAQVTVQYPNDLVSPDLPLPINLKIDNPNLVRKIEIRGQHDTFMTINLPEGNPVTEIGTRFTLVDDVIGVASTDSAGKTTTQGFKLNAPNKAQVPQDRGDTERKIGSGTILFKKSGVGYLIRRKPEGGEVRLLIQNAASRSHFVEKVTINLATSTGMKSVEIQGSPFWFEPMLILKGDFSDSSVASVVTK